MYNFPPMTPSSLCLHRCWAGSGIFPKVPFGCSSAERPCTAQVLNDKPVWEAWSDVLQHILLSSQGAEREHSAPVSPWGCSGMLLSSESKERAVIQDSDPETSAGEKGIPQTSVSGLQWPLQHLFTVFFSFCPSLAKENPAGSECQDGLQDFKYPLLMT